MTKTLNQIILFSSTKIRIFFQQHWESEYFFRTPTPPHWKLNGSSLRALKLPLLSYRRLRGDMIEETPQYKILNGKYDQDACTILKLWKDMAPTSSIRGTSLKLYPQRARTQLR
jgi:hypothetical protein